MWFISMAKQLPLNNVSVSVFEKDEKYFASVDFANSQLSPGYTASRDNIWLQLLNFISDPGLVAELQRLSKILHRVTDYY